MRKIDTMLFDWFSFVMRRRSDRQSTMILLLPVFFLLLVVPIMVAVVTPNTVAGNVVTFGSICLVQLPHGRYARCWCAFVRAHEIAYRKAQEKVVDELRPR